MASSLKQLLTVPKEKAAPGSREEAGKGTPDLKTKPQPDPGACEEPVDLTVQPQSPSPEAEYDKLLVSLGFMTLLYVVWVL